MMKKNLLWDTLNAVEQLEVSFEETLKTIDNINHRYKLISALKKLASKRQNSYEAEIQAAITASSSKVMPLIQCTKISSVSKKNRKKHKKHTIGIKLKNTNLSKTKTIPPSPAHTPMDQEMQQNVVCLRTNHEMQQETHTKSINRTKGNQSYRDRIRKLHEAAHRKLKQEARAISNERGKQMQLDREQYNENYSDQDQNQKLSFCDAYCCSSHSCQCEYF